MRKVNLDGEQIEVRGLKRKEVKALNREGIYLTELTPRQAEEAMDKVFDMVFSEAELARIEEAPNVAVMDVWQGVLKETYGAPDEEKNFRRPGPGQRTKAA